MRCKMKAMIMDMCILSHKTQCFLMFGHVIGVGAGKLRGLPVLVLLVLIELVVLVLLAVQGVLVVLVVLVVLLVLVVMAVVVVAAVVVSNSR